MIRWALRKAISKFERDWNYDASYMRDIIDASPRAAWLFARVTRFGQFRRDDFTHRDPLKPRTIVATLGGEIQGFATTALAPSDHDTPRCGELCALYIAPEWWDRVVGRSVVAAARSHLAEVDFDTAVLWMLAGNTRADSFYRRDGWRPGGVERTVPVWGVTIDERRYVRSLRGKGQEIQQ